mgnify:CR=1 FL=1
MPAHFPEIIGSKENTGDEKEGDPGGEEDSVGEGHSHRNEKLGLQGIVERLEVGKSYTMQILRSGKNVNLKVTVAEMPSRDRRPTPPPE